MKVLRSKRPRRISPERVVQLRNDYATGRETLDEMADRTGINRGTIWAIVRFRNYPDLGGAAYVQRKTGPKPGRKPRKGIWHTCETCGIRFWRNGARSYRFHAPACAAVLPQHRSILDPRNSSLEERRRAFMSRVQIKPDGCWDWTGSTDSGGYGTVTVAGVGIKAHRLSYSLFVGDIPQGLRVLHSCDRPICVAPDHLRLGTQADNVRDMIAKGRVHSKPSRRKGRVRQPAATEPFTCHGCAQPAARPLGAAQTHCTLCCHLNSTDAASRFWSCVQHSPEPNGCWVFVGRTGVQGQTYGSFRANGRSCPAHVVAYTLASGAIPAGMHVMHRCDNPPCCRPDHLRLGTACDNVRDRNAKGRTRVGRGEAQRIAKLTTPQVLEIRRRWDAGDRDHFAMANQFNVSPLHLVGVAKRRCWKHV